MAPSFRYTGESPHNRLARTSMTLAVLAAFSTLSFPIVFPFILASVALVMAELSKGGSEILIPRGRVASRIAVIVIAVNSFLLVISAVYFIRVLHDPELQKQERGDRSCSHRRQVSGLFGSEAEEQRQTRPGKRSS